MNTSVFWFCIRVNADSRIDTDNKLVYNKEEDLNVNLGKLDRLNIKSSFKNNTIRNIKS